MVNPRIKTKIRSYLEPLVIPLQKLGVSPTSVTLISFFLALTAVLSFFYFNRILAFSIFILSFILDGLDGVLARKTKKVTKFGAYLDSLIDKLVEALIFFCFAVYHWPLAFLTGVSSILISYSRHRADEFKVKIEGGIFERGPRILFVLLSGIILEATSLQQFVPHILLISLVLSLITIIQRVQKARRLL
jgi:phosphatidylglycerophosphate synthase